MNVPVIMATPLAGPSRVVVCAPSLTHFEVRALTCSPTPWNDLARITATEFE
jgi:hypothetical protein